MITFHILPRGTGKTLGCRNYLRDNPDSKFLIGDESMILQSAFLYSIHPSTQTTTIRGHSLHSTFVLDELTCYSRDNQSYIVQYADRYNFVIFTSSESFITDLSPHLRDYVYAYNPEYLL